MRRRGGLGSIPRRAVLAGVLGVAAAGCRVDDPVDPAGTTPADAAPDVIDAAPDVIDAAPDAIDATAGAVDATVGAFDAMSDVIDAIPDAIVDASDAIADTSETLPDAFDPDRERRCDDGLDDDGDGAIDCADGDCLADAPCRGAPMTPVERVQDLLLQRCGCHTGALSEGGLTLERPFTDHTVGVAAQLDPARILVVPGDVEASFLYLKLTADIPPGLGERMPPEIPYFEADQLATVADWITSLR